MGFANGVSISGFGQGDQIHLSSGDVGGSLSFNGGTLDISSASGTLPQAMASAIPWSERWRLPKQVQVHRSSTHRMAASPTSAPIRCTSVHQPVWRGIAKPL